MDQKWLLRPQNSLDHFPLLGVFDRFIDVVELVECDQLVKREAALFVELYQPGNEHIRNTGLHDLGDGARRAGEEEDAVSQIHGLGDVVGRGDDPRADRDARGAADPFDLLFLRGDDHVSNTPFQILIYQALGWDIPKFGHMPMILGPDRKRLSKRHGAMSVTAYRDMGFLPQAVLNYLVRLGWSHGDQEFFTRDELIKVFDLENIGKSAGVFDLDKLQALNAEHIMAAAPGDLVAPLKPFMKAAGIEVEDQRTGLFTSRTFWA